MRDNTFQIIEYIWQDKFDGIRSKTKVFTEMRTKLIDIPPWDFAYTNKAKEEVDLFMVPRRLYKDPFRGGHHLMVFCDSYQDPDHLIPSEINSRYGLAQLVEDTKSYDILVGIEQEYMLFDVNTGHPLKWKSNKEPLYKLENRHYCSVGGDRCYGREIVEEHMLKCLQAGIHYWGCIQEETPSQWEFQIGTVDPLTAADDLHVARYILAKLTEKHNMFVSFDPKPIGNDMCFCGGHVNISTNQMRGENGFAFIKQAVNKLSLNHKEDLKYYGENNEKRLSECKITPLIDKFTWGFDRVRTSVRINAKTKVDGKGYLEDRRPASNLDPNKVLARLIMNICH